ncbi:MAG: HEAT repeat domain-containing protein [Elusimicrobia bacterium]|nr:HEAT repeat domain-containing protein [Elusimicrobiota bacterium]
MTLLEAALHAFLLFSAAGCAQLAAETPGAPGAQPATATVAPVKVDPQITTALIELIESKDRFRVDMSKAQGTPLGEIVSVGSPIGYELRNRFLNISIPLTEAVSRDKDPVFRDRLVNLARWDSNNETRSAALIALAGAHDPASLDVFREAVAHLDPAVRFGTLEALVAWGQPEKAKPILSAAMQNDSEPILRVYAAAGLARLGDPAGLSRLRAALDDPSWLVRAMAARYIGESGAGDDYKLLVSRLGRELSNDFVAAEYCIAAIKLFPKAAP